MTAGARLDAKSFVLMIRKLFPNEPVILKIVSAHEGASLQIVFMSKNKEGEVRL